MNRPCLAAIAFGCGIAAATTVRSAPALLGPSTKTWEEIEAAGQPGKNSRPIFQSPTATLDELEMHVTHLPAGKAPHPPHQHVQEELVIIKEGTLEAFQSGKTRKLGPGSVIFQASNQMHGVRNVGTTPASYYVIRWTSPGQTPPPKAASK